MKPTDFYALKNHKVNPWVHRLWIITVGIIAILVMMLFLPWEQTVRGEGQLMAQNPSERGYMIAATVDGFVDKLYVRENQKVKRGDPLFEMVDLDQNYSERIERMDQNLKQQMVHTQEEYSTLIKNRDNSVEQMATGKELYAKKYQQGLETLKSLEFRKSAVSENYRVERLNYERVKTLYEESIESKRSLERAENSYIKAKTELDKVNVEIDIQKRQLEIIETEKEQFLLDASNKVRMIENTMNSSQVRLHSLRRDGERQESDIARYATSDVKAEKDGYVMRVLVNDKNRYVPKGEPVIHFAPNVTKRMILMKISDFHMPLIKPGLPVRIRFYGWPTLQISGWPKIQFGTFAGTIERVDPIAFEEGWYYAYIVENPDEPWPSDNDLRIGTRATVWARLSTVPIWYQLWRTMNAIPPKMVRPDKEL